ncbi:MAG: response regulator transcription factor [Vicinamibacterales bacterium]
MLVIEDDETICELLHFHLGLAGIACTVASGGSAALRLGQSQPFDLLILDLGLPEIDGLTLCQCFRREGPNREVPILMVTAKREEADKVLGLESGADDYVTKPFLIRELMARVKALLRRPRSTWRAVPAWTPDSAPVAGLGITIDPARQRVERDGRPVSLTPQEFRLLHILVSSPDIVFGRAELLRTVWQDDVNVTPRSVDALVKRLRRKIEADPARPALITTVFGSGYKFGTAT